VRSLFLCSGNWELTEAYPLPTGSNASWAEGFPALMETSSVLMESRLALTEGTPASTESNVHHAEGFPALMEGQKCLTNHLSDIFEMSDK